MSLVIRKLWVETVIDEYLSSVTYKLCGLERLFFKVALKTRSNTFLRHNLAHSRCSVNSRDCTPILSSARVHP